MRVWVSALAVLSCVLSSCAPQDVVVAELPEAPEGGFHRRRPCIENGDCDPRELCARSTCGDRNGRCERRPIFCENARALKCGCDGVTYWNDCLRRQAGVPASTDGECTVTGASCELSKECPVGGASCGKVSPEMRCDGAGSGVCWMLPVTCPPDNGPRFVSCDPHEPACTDACTAIRSEKPHRALLSTTCM